MKKRSCFSLVILVIILAVLLVLGFSEGVFQTELLESKGRLGAETLLRLLTMAAAVMAAEHLLVLLLGLPKPKSHRVKSIITLSTSILRYTAALVILCWGLTILGVNIMAVVASVGVLALIVGFSAESLIADMVTGLFMLFENQYNVGDIVEVCGFRGTVTDIGLRTTSITDSSDNIKIINNADMRNILNRSDRSSKAVVDVGIPYEIDLEWLEAKLPALLEKIYAANSEQMNAVPVYLGVQELGSSAVVLRFCVDVTEKNIYAAQRSMNRGLLLGLRGLGVECPYQQLDVHSK